MCHFLHLSLMYLKINKLWQKENKNYIESITTTKGITYFKLYKFNLNTNLKGNGGNVP